MLRIFGAVGKASTRIMTEAVLAQGANAPDVPLVVVLSPDADEQGVAWSDASVGLDAGTIAVLNADGGVPAGGVTAWTNTFGLTDAAGLRAKDLDATLDGTAFTLTSDAGTHRVHLRLLGEHQVINALAAVTVGLASGVPLDRGIGALERLEALGRGRMQPLPAPGGYLVIDDTVSANLRSTSAALKTLAQIVGGRRSVAVLGELSAAVGDGDLDDIHDRIGRLIVRLNVRKLVVVGHSARHIHNAAGLEGSWDGESVLVDTPEQAYDFLRDELREQDVVLVKSSKHTGFDSLAEQLAGSAR